MERLRNHVGNSALCKSVNLNRHGLVNLIVKHGDKAIHLADASERFLYLLFSETHVDFKSRLVVEKLAIDLGAIEDVRIIGLTIGQLPRRILHGVGHLGTNLLENRTVFPCVHHDTRGVAAIGAVYENDPANSVRQLLNVVVHGVGANDSLTQIDHVRKVFV